MTELKHTHYSPYGPPRQAPGTLLDCTPEFPSQHRVEGSELAADYMYCPRFGPDSATGLPFGLLISLRNAYTHHRSKDTSWRIVDVVTDDDYIYRVTITNRTGYGLDGAGPLWHSEEWGLYPDGEWHGIPVNPHPPYDHMPPWCSNCGY